MHKLSDKIFNYIQDELNYSNYQIKLLRYFFKSIAYELSKFLIFGVYFLFMDYFGEYLVAVLVLLSIRLFIGGLHFKTYIGCLIFSFGFFNLGVLILPLVHIHKLAILVALLICIAVTNVIGPIVSSYRKTPSGILIKKSKLNASVIIFIYVLLVYIIPLNQCIITGFWIIILQTVQLTVAFIFRKRRC